MAATDLAGRPARHVDAPARAKGLEDLLFFSLAILLIVPIWLFPYFPSMDGPVHMNIAQIMLGYDDPDYAFYRKYFEFNDNIEPNLLTHLVLAGLASFMDIFLAEKVFLTGFILLFAVAARSAVHAVNPAATAVGFLFLPIIFNNFTNQGFYNFSVGLALFLLVFAYWYANRDRLGWIKIAALGVMGILIVWTHLIAFLMLAVTIGFVTSFESARRWLAAGGAERRGIVIGYLKRAAILLLTFAPALVFAVSFFDRHGFTDAPADGHDIVNRIKHLLTMSFLFAHAPVEILLMAPLLLMIVFLCGRQLLRILRERRLRTADGLLFGTILLAALYLAIPVTTKGAEVTARFLPYILFALLLWTATTALPRRLARATMVAAAVVVVVTTGYRVWKFDQLNALVAEYISVADQVERGSTLLALHFWRDDMPLMDRQMTWRSDPLRHASSYIAIQREAVDLRSHMMEVGYFPIRYRPELAPYTHIGRWLERAPPEASFIDFDERTGGSVDYVLLWAYGDNETSETPEAKAILAELEEGYDLVEVSPANGLTRLYRRKDLTAAAGGS